MWNFVPASDPSSIDIVCASQVEEKVIADVQPGLLDEGDAVFSVTDRIERATIVR